MKLGRIARYFVALAMSVAPIISHTQHEASATSNGAWGFCTTTNETYCILKISVTSSDGVVTDYRTSEETSAVNMTYSVNCTMASGSCAGAPTMKQLQSWVDSGCKTDLALGLNRPQIRITGGMKDHPTWKFSIELSTGNFDPMFALGQGTTKTVRTENADGTFGFLWEAIPVIVAAGGGSASLGNPSTNPNYFAEEKESLKTAVATSVSYLATVNLLPASQFLTGPCGVTPITGSWVEANANAWKFGQPSADLSKQIFPFTASSPHFIPGELLSKIELGPAIYSPIPKEPTLEENKIVNAARIRMFLSAPYLKSIGYATPNEFTTASFSVATEDDQTPTPSFVLQDGGVLLNFGVAHYSAPNPKLTVFVKPVSTTTSTASTSVVPTTAAALTPTLEIIVSKKVSLRAIARFAKLTTSSSSKFTAKVTSASTKNCRLSGSFVKGTRYGKCRLRITVTTKTGKTSSRYVTAIIKK